MTAPSSQALGLSANGVAEDGNTFLVASLLFVRVPPKITSRDFPFHGRHICLPI